MSSLFSSKKKNLDRVRELQSMFASRISASSVPGNDGAAPAAPTGKLPGGKAFVEGSTVGSSFVFIRDESLVCGGVIGAGGKFCVKQRSECAIVKHERSRFQELVAGLYLKGPNNDSYCSPCVPSKFLGQDAIQRLMNEHCDDVGEARKKLDIIIASGVKCDTASDVDALIQTKKPLRFATPVKKESKNLNLRAKFDTVLNVVNEESGEGRPGNEDDKTQRFNEYLIELTSTVEENQADIERIHDQIFESTSQIGIAPKSCPPTLWVAHMEVKGELEEVTESLKRKADVSISQQTIDLQTKLSGVERDYTKLRKDVEVSFQEVANELYAVGNQVPNNPATSIGTNSLQQLQDIDTRLNTLQKLVGGGPHKDASKQFCIKIGKFYFNSMDDVAAWADKHLPQDYPFGSFVDAYSFLERVKSARDVSELSNAVNEMDTRRKASLSADESIVVEAFQHPLPRCFRGGSTSTVTHCWLPGVKSREIWENDTNTRGVKIAIRDTMEGIRYRIDAIISQRLHQHQEAADLARVLLSDTVTFVTSLSSFISTTCLNLKNAGYPESEAWNLVCKLVYRIFATDCFHDKRGVATEMLDSENHRSMSIGILWGTFATHHVMREYMKYSFADHPSIGGEYTRFLVANAGISKIAKAEKTIENLSSLLSSLEKKLDQVDKKATTASSKADEAIKVAKKPKRPEA